MKRIGFTAQYQQEPVSKEQINVCQKCKGTGLTIRGEPCRKCYGTGHYCRNKKEG